jgi:hypothetical protein
MTEVIKHQGSKLKDFMHRLKICWTFLRTRKCAIILLDEQDDGKGKTKLAVTLKAINLNNEYLSLLFNHLAVEANQKLEAEN